MPDEPQLPARVYADEEIGKILKRATELQHREPSAPAAGVTLAELEEIAAEAGIDPTYLRRAAMEVDAGTSDPTVWTKVAGDELVLVREITLPGEFGVTGFERIVAAIQAASSEHGQPSLMGRTLTWRAETASKTRTIQIVVSSRDGKTNIRAEENLMQMASGLFGGITAGAGIGVGMGFGLPIGLNVLGSVLFAVAAPVGTVALSYIATRAIYRSIVEGRRRGMNKLFEAIVTEAKASIDEHATLALPPGEDAPT
ncbi:MAG: hypothetical protein OEN56_04480 [Gemmatimonadota bacterium]|nr:hypothetical protein [Gemmatimonadota bacterium]